LNGKGGDGSNGNNNSDQAIQLKEHGIKDFRMLVQFKIEYLNYIQNELEKLNWKKVVRVVKVKAEIQTIDFYNGTRNVSVLALKILSA
jgi:hypothetical protein